MRASRVFIVILYLVVFFSAKAQQPRLMLPMGHTHKITVMAFSPDAKKIATGSEDKTIKLWDTQTGKLLANLKGHLGEIKTLAFNAGGDRLLSVAGQDSVARLWNAGDGSLVREFRRSNYAVGFALFSPDGKSIVLENDGKPVIYSANSGDSLVVLQRWSSLSSARFSPDSRYIITPASGGAEIWDATTGKQVSTLKGHESFVEHTFFTPDGTKAVTSSYDKTIGIWEPSTGKLLKHLKGSQEYAVIMGFSPDGKRLASAGSFDRNVVLWDLEEGKKITDLRISDYAVANIQFSSDSKILFTTGSYTTQAWDAVTGASRPFNRNGRLVAQHNAGILQSISIKDSSARIEGDYESTLENSGELQSGLFSPDGSLFFGTSGDGTGKIWNAKTGRLNAELKGFTFRVTSATVHPSMNFFITSSAEKAFVWDLENNLIQSSPQPWNTDAQHLLLSPSGKYMLKIEKDTTASIWDPEEKVSLWDAGSSRLLNPNLWVRGMQNISIINQGSYLFSEDETKLFISNNDWGSYIFELPSGKMIFEITHPRLWFATVNPSFTRFIQQVAPQDASQSPVLTLFDLQSGSKVNDFNVEANGWEKVRFLRSSGNVLFYDQSISLYAEKGKKALASFPNGSNELNKSETRMLVYTYDTLGIWDVVRGRQVFVLKGGIDHSFTAATWSPDEKNIIYAVKGNIYLADAETGKVISKVGGKAQRFQKSDDGKLVFAIYDDQATILDAASFSVITTLKGHENSIDNVFRMKNEEMILTIAEDNTARVWELRSGKLLYTYLIMGKEYQFVTVPSGYYMANPGATKLLHYVSPDLKVISFEQLDVKYNRPDLVLKDAGANSELITSYRKAWEKRLKRLGLQPQGINDTYSLPQADIRNRDAIAYEQSSSQLSLRIFGSDSLNKLTRFNVWINESPLYGQRGHSIARSGKKNLDTTIRVTLSAGINQIEVSVINEKGGESYRMPLVVNYQTDAKPVTYFVGLGVDAFKDSKYDLQYSVKDIRDLVNNLREKLGDALIIDTVFNEKFNITALGAIKKKLLQRNVNDRVIVAYSGHGLLSQDFDYYLSTTNVNFDKPEQNGLPYEELENLLDSIPSRKKLLLIDACHSGEVDKEDLVQIGNAPDSLVKGLKPVAYKKEGQMGLQNSFELMQQLFVDVGKNTGATVISAAAGTQFALERNDLENGVFTFSVIELMKTRRHIRVSELKKKVAARVFTLTDGLQRPTFRNETRVVDWEVW